MLLKSFVKRSLAFLLCAVMLVSCWVFTAPSASAAQNQYTTGAVKRGDYTFCHYTDDSEPVYHIEIDINVINAGNGYDRTFTGTALNKNNNESHKDMGGMVVYYKDNNGTASTEKAASLDLGFNYKFISGQTNATIFPYSGYSTSNWVGKTQQGDCANWNNKKYTLYADLSGFPTQYAVYNNNDNAYLGGAATTTEWEVEQIRVYAYDSEINMTSSFYPAYSSDKTMDNQPNIIFKGSIRTSNWHGERPGRYLVSQDGTVSIWNPNGYNHYSNESGNNWVHFDGFADGNNAFTDTSSSCTGTPNPQYSKSWQMPAPPEVPSYSYTKTFSDSSLADTYRYVAPEHATNNFAYNTQNVRDQYGALLSGTVSTDFIISDYRIYNGSSLIQNPNPYTDTLSISSTGEITPIKANSYAYHNLTVKPQVTWAPGDGIASQTFDGSSTKVGLTFPEYTLNYTYTQQNLGDAAPEFDPDDYDTEYMPSGYTENTTGATQTALYGDLPDEAATPSAEQSSYYDASNHYSGSWSLPGSGLTQNPTEQQMVYSAGTAHSWSGAWTQYAGTVNGFSSAEFHRDSCSVNGTHYKYQAHNWEKENGNIVWRTEIAGEHAGEHYKKCTSCNYIAYGSHDYTSVTTDPTCTADGYITHTCNTCGYSYKEYPNTDKIREDYEDFAALGHAPGESYSSDSSNHWRICQREGCGVKIDDSGSVGQSGHSLDAGVITTQPTCSAEGVKTFTCSICSNQSNTTGVDALGHNFTDTSIRNETTQKTAPTCTTDGEYYYGCSRCDAISHNIDGMADMSFTVITEDETGYRLGHGWGDVKSAHATDNTEGYLYYQCSRCDIYCAASYDANNIENGDNGYSPNEGIINTQQSSVSSGATVPAPKFNDDNGAAQFYDGVTYSDRPASFKYDSSTDFQTMRFAGSVKIPEGISEQIGSQDDNVVTDFGFVYTQTKYICDVVNNKYQVQQTVEEVFDDEGTSIGEYSYLEYPTADSTRLVYDFENDTVVTGTDNIGQPGYKVYKMSVVNPEANTTQIANGYSFYDKSSAGSDARYFSFNLVISVKQANWEKEYSARPYIRYKYHGKTYTVYDGGASAGNSAPDREKYSHRSVMELADDIICYNPFNEKMIEYLKENMGWTYDTFLIDAQYRLKDKEYAENKFYNLANLKTQQEALEEQGEENCYVYDDFVYLMFCAIGWVTSEDVDYFLDPEQSLEEGNYKGVDWFNGVGQN